AFRQSHQFGELYRPSAPAGLLVQLDDRPGWVGMQRLQPVEDVVGKGERDELGGPPVLGRPAPAIAGRGYFVHKTQSTRALTQENIDSQKIADRFGFSV